MIQVMGRCMIVKIVDKEEGKNSSSTKLLSLNKRRSQCYGAARLESAVTTQRKKAFKEGGRFVTTQHQTNSTAEQVVILHIAKGSIPRPSRPRPFLCASEVSSHEVNTTSCFTVIHHCGRGMGPDQSDTQQVTLRLSHEQCPQAIAGHVLGRLHVFQPAETA